MTIATPRRTALRLALAGLALTASAGASAMPMFTSASVSDRLLAQHNMVRGQAGVAPMQWDAGLAAAAAGYASELAQTGRWGHSPKATRPGQGENLWMGTRGAFSPEQMVGGWLSEARWFRAGAFPAVSSTGNWADVGHYSQILWRGTTHVGCAIRSSARYDYLVCRYSPPGNVDGRMVY